MALVPGYLFPSQSMNHSIHGAALRTGSPLRIYARESTSIGLPAAVALGNGTPSRTGDFAAAALPVIGRPRGVAAVGRASTARKASSARIAVRAAGDQPRAMSNMWSV